MFRALRKNEKKIVDDRVACLERATRLMTLASQANTELYVKRQYAFEALEEIERFGKTQITEASAPFVRQVVQLISEKCEYPRTDIRGVNRELQLHTIDKLSVGYSYAGTMFADLFRSAALYHLDQQNYGFAKTLALNLVRVEVSRHGAETAADGSNSHRVYEALLILSAIYARVGEPKRALEIREDAIEFAKDEGWMQHSQDVIGSNVLIPAFAAAAVSCFKERKVAGARSLAEAAQLQAALRDKRYEDFRRMSVLLAQICIEQGDFEKAYSCLADIGCADALAADAAPDIFRIVVSSLAQSMGAKLDC